MQYMYVWGMNQWLCTSMLNIYGVLVQFWPTLGSVLDAWMVCLIKMTVCLIKMAPHAPGPANHGARPLLCWVLTWLAWSGWHPMH